ncbi:mRNA-binding protein PUF3 [Sugiyamaella lignohabitans]|uniref:Pumilio homology domain family member 3 n=1 Tax=Sugiyamaella lignohabitans TaxID=796027 RepID=A0A167D7D5_9ASCO|nr:mRNA-binding protein PUF3 [Sugiyamaella lignohabitans]ANB12572.1 mRNA-binding protein PUF3 [Sugiyamaella lignohabitans]
MSGFSDLNLGNRKNSTGSNGVVAGGIIGSAVGGFSDGIGMSDAGLVLSPRSGTQVLNGTVPSSAGTSNINSGNGSGPLTQSYISLIQSPTSSVGSAKLAGISTAWERWSQGGSTNGSVNAEGGQTSNRNRGLSWDGRIVEGINPGVASSNRRTSAVTEPAGLVSASSVYGLSPGLSNLTLSPSRGNINLASSSSPRVEDQYFAYESRKTVAGSSSIGDMELPTSFRNQPKSPPYFIQNQAQSQVQTLNQSSPLSLRDRLAQIAEATREAELLADRQQQHQQQQQQQQQGQAVFSQQNSVSTFSSPSSTSGIASINNSTTNLPPFSSPGVGGSVFENIGGSASVSTATNGSTSGSLDTATPVYSVPPNAAPNYSDKQSRSSSFSSVWHNNISTEEPEHNIASQNSQPVKPPFFFYPQQQQQNLHQQSQMYPPFDPNSEIAAEFVDYPASAWSKGSSALTSGAGTPPVRSDSQGSDQGGALRQQFQQQFISGAKFPSTSRGSGSSFSSASGFFRPFEPNGTTVAADSSAIFEPSFMVGGSQSNGKNQAQQNQSPHTQQSQNPQLRLQSPTPAQSQQSPTFHHQPRSSKRNNDHMPSSVRSPLLEDFRNNKSKKFDLKDLYGHVVEFSGDQHGSRFIQQRLETASPEEKDIIFNEVRPNCLQLMTDVFGNYVIQKFFELGNQLQKTVLAKHMESHILDLSLQMYGCRVVQKAIEHVLLDQQIKLITELDGHVLKCVKDQNGNHVIQKAIERIPAGNIKFIFDSFHDQVYQLATHPYGCRVIQRMLEHCDEPARRVLLDELHTYTTYLVEDQYGNYVVQHVIEHGQPEDRAKAIAVVRDSLVTFSRHKFASNVVEKCVLFGSESERRDLIDEILKARSDNTSSVAIMMKDQFANYVIQKLLEVSKGDDYDRLVNAIKPQLQSLKKYTYGKHLVSIERLLFPEDNSGPTISSSINSQKKTNAASLPTRR